MTARKPRKPEMNRKDAKDAENAKGARDAVQLVSRGFLVHLHDVSGRKLCKQALLVAIVHAVCCPAVGVSDKSGGT